MPLLLFRRSLPRTVTLAVNTGQTIEAEELRHNVATRLPDVIELENCLNLFQALGRLGDDD